MSVRKVVTRRHIGMCCQVPSLKMKRMIECESMLEGDAIPIFDRDPDVLWFEEQPCTESVYASGTPFQYTPDFLLKLSNGCECYVEVKPETKLRSPKLKYRLGFIAKHFAMKCKDFRILTEVEIRNAPMRSNLRRLQHHTRDLPTSFEFWAKVQSLSQVVDLTLGKACHLLHDRRTVMRLMSHGCFRFDMAQPISDETKLQLISTEARNATFQI